MVHHADSAAEATWWAAARDWVGTGSEARTANRSPDRVRCRDSADGRPDRGDVAGPANPCTASAASCCTCRRRRTSRGGRCHCRQWWSGRSDAIRLDRRSSGRPPRRPGRARISSSRQGRGCRSSRGTSPGCFGQLCDRAGVPRSRLHDLRHTCVSLLLDLGVPPRVVMEIVGHSTIEMTMTVYGHVSLDTQREALGKLDNPLDDES
ncbi:MAG TPA: tyrosine-type recombinase/integrase [Mycobacteriales bacterium]|nr:tyrosine-type recombinase/integrase [Mycobacteriales bacterium]